MNTSSKHPKGTYRWTICALVFFATTINYIDRTVISLLKTELETEFHWSESDYSNIVIAFQLSYAIGMTGMGRLIDHLGTKSGYLWSIFIWSLAAIGHALVKTTTGFYMARAALGISEAGNFPAAIKATAEWFPKKERALATGIFNSGSNIGAIAAPLTVPYIAEKYGWQMAFVLTGAVGFGWMIAWYFTYDLPANKSKLSPAELEYIHSGEKDPETGNDERLSWSGLFRQKATWAFAIGKFLTDPVWWFYLFWLPAFLKVQYGLTGSAIALPVALVFTLASMGSIYGGWLPMKLMNRHWTVTRARRGAMLIYAVAAFPVLFAQFLGGMNMWYAVLAIGFAAAAHQAWSANIFTTVSDHFSKSSVASVIGIGGMTGALGGIVLSNVAGRVFDFYKAAGSIEKGYYFLFLYCGSAYLISWLISQILSGRNRNATLIP